MTDWANVKETVDEHSVPGFGERVGDGIYGETAIVHWRSGDYARYGNSEEGCHHHGKHGKAWAHLRSFPSVECVVPPLGIPAPLPGGGDRTPLKTQY
jgi:hypothetical protein